MPTIHDERPKLEALKAELEREEPMSEIGCSYVITGAEISGDGTSWIEVMPIAEKARNGPHFFTITAEDLTAAASYIQANPDRIPVDYDHAGAEGGSTKAAGWFTGNAEVRGESLWAEVKWTPAAVQEIRDGSFRFVSPEWEMETKDSKTGLWTTFKALAAATLTNRPFFSELEAVTARAEPEQIEALTEEHGEDIAELVLASLEVESTHDAAERLLGAVWTTSYINDLPDSSFLYISPGGSKDSDGKTTPRSLRHFPVKDANGSPDMAHVRNALARIPQSNVPADAKARATAAAQRLLRDAGGNPSATDQGQEDTTQEATVADETVETNEPQVTDYMKMLGLDNTVDPKHRLAAAFRDKDEKILALEQERTELTAKLKEADKLNDRVAELEQRDRERDIEVILTSAVSKGRVFPAEKEKLAEIFAKDVNGLRQLIATRPAEMFAQLEPKGVTGDADRFVDDPEVSRYVKTLDTGGDAVDTEQAKQHLAAMDILKEQGKADNYTNDEYIRAYDQARSLVY